jgi:pilus assembly protein TadC
MFTSAELGTNMVEQIASFLSRVWTLPISAIIYLALCYVLLSGFVIMPLWALKLYIQNRRNEKLLRGESRVP